MQNNKITFIPKTIPGDEVEIKITKSKKNFNEGEIVSFIKRAGNHLDNICPYYDICGGCHLQGLSYDETLKYKEDRIRNILNRCNINLPINIIRNDNPLNYRNKIELKVKNSKIGFYKAKSHDILEIKTCAITSSAINNFLEELKSFNIINGDVIIRNNYKNSQKLTVILIKGK